MALPFDIRGINDKTPTHTSKHERAPGLYVYAHELQQGHRVDMPGGIGTVRHTRTESPYTVVTIDQYTRRGKGPIRLHTWTLITPSLSYWRIEE